MRKPKKAEKLFLEELFQACKSLQVHQRGLEIGHLIALMRGQLKMSQRALAERAHIPQSSISRIESSSLEPNVSTLKKILDALSCDLVITAAPRQDLETLRRNQALTKAEKKIQYLNGTMSLEKQAPSARLLQELINDEVKDLLDAPGSSLWDNQQ